tara:strand:+ start:898 stop:1341 length:444 start_codon:yes stop_codon:yes gene_type:complete
MNEIKETLQKLKISSSNKKYGILLASIMFLWSGVSKIRFFEKKVSILMKKTGLSNVLSSFGMILVILLETIGFLILIDYFFKLNLLTTCFIPVLNKQEVAQIILLLILLFLIVVTYLYHPFNLKHPIPFLSNLTTFGLFLYVYSDLN